MKLLTASILLVACFSTVPQRDLPVDLLKVHVNTAEAQIKPRTPGQRADYGESVAFLVQADFRCGRDAAAESVVVSISDTHYRHVPATGDKSVLATVVVPGEQLAPVDVSDFCTIESSRNGALLLPAAATAQVSLRCRIDAVSTISFVSAPLPLRLVCDEEPGQDASASAAPLAR